MKILKKVLSLIVVTILLLHIAETTTYASPDASTQKTIKAAVFLNDFNNLFFSNIKKGLEDVQKEHENKIEFTFFDSKGNQLIENENIDKALNSNFDLFVVNPVTTKTEEIENALSKITSADIPLIIYLPPTSSLVGIIKTAPRAVVINEDVNQAGTLQGKILADAWNTNKDTLDKNKDNIMQYVLLQGTTNYESTIARTKYSIRALNEADIKTQQLLSTVCNWNRECARTAIESAFLTMGDKIEVIISNNDEMAIGAVEALQKYGFNKGGNSRYIPVVGIAGLPEAKKLVDDGIMTGTVAQDFPTLANAIYAVGVNLVLGNNPVKDTNLKFDETGITIKIPGSEYVKTPENK
jgi:methyl-galactoside transport system substrate-binding protein